MLKRFCCLTAALLLALIGTAPAENGEAWICTNCGEKNTGNFCEECGAPNPVWTCICGSVNMKKFCPVCGRSRESVIAAQTETPLPAMPGDNSGNDLYGPTEEKDGESWVVFMTQPPVVTPAPTMRTEYAGATPMVIDPIDKPTPTPIPPVTFSYIEYEAEALCLRFQGPEGWIVSDSGEDGVYLLINPDPSMDYPAEIRIRAVPVNGQYSKNELVKEIKAAMEDIRNEKAFSGFDKSNTASRNFIAGNGVYAKFNGILKENGTKISGRVIANCADKTLYILTVIYPRGLEETYNDVYNTIRSTMTIVR